MAVRAESDTVGETDPLVEDARLAGGGIEAVDAPVELGTEMIRSDVAILDPVGEGHARVGDIEPPVGAEAEVVREQHRPGLDRVGDHLDPSVERDSHERCRGFVVECPDVALEVVGEALRQTGPRDVRELRAIAADAGDA
jgi:hypothetical protein